MEEEKKKAAASEAAKDLAIQELMKQVANLTAMLGPAHGFAKPPNQSTGKTPQKEVIPQEGTDYNDVQRQSHPLRANEQSGEASAASHHSMDDNGQDSGATMAGVDPNPG